MVYYHRGDLDVNEEEVVAKSRNTFSKWGPEGHADHDPKVKSGQAGNGCEILNDLLCIVILFSLGIL